MSLDKLVNIIAIVLLLAFGATALIVMQKTTESNSIVATQTRHQSKKRSKVVKEVRLLTLELKNLQKDVDKMRKVIEKGRKSRGKK